MEVQGDRKQFFPAADAIKVFKMMSDEDINDIGLDAVHARPDWLLVTVLPVPPLHVRPSIFAGGSQSHDDLTHQVSESRLSRDSVETQSSLSLRSVFAQSSLSLRSVFAQSSLALMKTSMRATTKLN